jgi:hypothetical protein
MLRGVEEKIDDDIVGEGVEQDGIGKYIVV